MIRNGFRLLKFPNFVTRLDHVIFELDLSVSFVDVDPFLIKGQPNIKMKTKLISLNNNDI